MSDRDQQQRTSRWGRPFIMGGMVHILESDRRQWRQDTIDLLNSRRYETRDVGEDGMPALEPDERLVKPFYGAFMLEVPGGYRLIGRISLTEPRWVTHELPGYELRDAERICRAMYEGYLYRGQLDGEPPPQP